jgi:hypothetical protein
MQVKLSVHSGWMQHMSGGSCSLIAPSIHSQLRMAKFPRSYTSVTSGLSHGLFLSDGNPTRSFLFIVQIPYKVQPLSPLEQTSKCRAHPQLIIENLMCSGLVLSPEHASLTRKAQHNSSVPQHPIRNKPSNKHFHAVLEFFGRRPNSQTTSNDRLRKNTNGE